MTKPDKQARAYAFQLYSEGHYQQKEIAAIVGVSEKTMTQWKRVGQWEEIIGPVALPKDTPPWCLRVLALLASQQQQLAQLGEQLAKLLPAPTADFCQLPKSPR